MPRMMNANQWNKETPKQAPKGACIKCGKIKRWKQMNHKGLCKECR